MTIQCAENPVHVVAVWQFILQGGLTNILIPLGIMDNLADNSTSGCKWVGKLEKSVKKGLRKTNGKTKMTLREIVEEDLLQLLKCR